MPQSPIDLRSDTLTQPTAGMRAAMAAAAVGDDVYGEDPTVNELEARVARLLGKETALFCPSGTMANLIALLTATRPGEVLLSDQEAHVVHYELAGHALIGGLQLRTFDAPAGCPTPAAVEAGWTPGDDHEPAVTLLCLETTHNRRGGAVAPLAAMEAAASAAHGLGMQVHLDGARLLNAALVLGCPPAALAGPADSVMLSLSKGLGCPAGSLWLGAAAARVTAHRWRKRLGGGMRQVGILAAAGLYALDHHVDRLGEDHRVARRLATGLAGAPGLVVDPGAVVSNIVMVRTERPAALVVERAAAAGVLTVALGSHLMRCVTHLGVDAAAIDAAVPRLRAAGA